MANEISVTTRLTVENGNFKADRNPGRILVDQATLAAIANVQTIGTSYEAITLGDVSTEGYCYLRNLDSTNFVDVGTDGGAALVPFLRLKAGECAVFRISTNAIYALADTAACKLDVLILEA
jgi:hypothetical protein